MKRSVNELIGLVLKAARGAGLPLGVAEDLAAAAPYLDPSGLETLSMALGDPTRQADLVALCAAVDARLCRLPADLPSSVSTLAEGLENAASATALPPSGPRTIPDDLWAVLDCLARTTFVPASEASRAAGAGAGLDDND